MRYSAIFAGIVLVGVLVGCQSASLTAAKLYVKEGETERAIEQLQVALAEDPANPEIHYMLGQLAAEQGRYEDMSESFKNSLELSDAFRLKIKEIQDHYWAREYNKGVSQVTGGNPDFDNAHSIFTNATVIDPQRLEAWRNLAYVNYSQQDLPAAIEIYQHILTIAPSDTAALSTLGTLYLNQSDYDKAIEVLERRATAEGVGANTYVNMGIAYEGLERAEEAEQAYESAVEADPTLFAGHYSLGTYHWNKQQYREAADSFEKAVELQPEDEGALYNLAIAYMSLEKLDPALKLLEDLSVRTPDNGRVWSRLGRIYAVKGKIKESEHAYARAEALGQ